MIDSEVTVDEDATIGGVMTLGLCDVMLDCAIGSVALSNSWSDFSYKINFFVAFKNQSVLYKYELIWGTQNQAALIHSPVVCHYQDLRVALKMLLHYISDVLCEQDTTTT